MNLRGKKILVTGASGFLGARLVEYLVLAHGADVRALVRDLGRSVRLARLPVELVFGDVRDEGEVRSAVDGCSIVLHCASRIDAGLNALASSTFLGTKIVAESALRQHVEKFVHVSSCAVYGLPGDKQIDESCSLTPRWKGDTYGSAKISAEKLVHKLSGRGLPALIVEPTIIYGPYSGEWSIHPLQILRQANYALPRGGLCNPVYVDDVVRAIILAGRAKRANGERYLISGPEVVEWTTVYKLLEAKGTKGRVISVTDGELSTYLAEKQQSKSNTARVIQRKANTAAISAGFEAVASRPLFVPPAGLLALYKARVRYGIGKAEKELGYRPQVNLDQGMKLTADWARWSRLL